MRLFFAALPDEATRARLAAAGAALSIATPARLVPGDNHHVTLAFIGEVAESDLPQVEKIGSMQSVGKFSVRFDAYEYWPKPEVIVVAARTVPPRLDQLWQQLHRDLGAQQWALEAKRLRPHVTLARKVAQAPVLPAMSPFEWGVRAFSLMRSDTSGIQSAYTVVATWQLLDE